ncbi:FAD-binding protein [Actinomyces viscosus]|uniref:Protoporphyrinogen oxidase n=1 Tax=Actinomyces viscosus TaxID=1656 RepID=A0A3S4VKR2_ACTVI|nr:FAD-dependent oxidoreductase [Actinomyces viscosus]TFH52449.1 FAD-binding protein [Actinomyces viscosus]VEI17116.1 Protoporphyrinogen oxidase [Actinomyces viscosus]
MTLNPQDNGGHKADGRWGQASPPETGERPVGTDDSQATVQRWDALVVGGGIAGLTAAWDLVRAGLRPLLIEARGYTGGLVAAGRIGGARLDLGAEGFVVRGEAATSMLAELGLRATAPHGRPRLFLPPLAPAAGGGDSSSWALHRFPRDAYLGIPADPLAPDVVEIIGTEAARRAAEDAVLPGSVGTGPDDPADLASFVTARMGSGVLERLVRPIVAGIHSADPADLAADVVVPGLRRATAELGSLNAAVAAVLERRRARQDGAGGRSVDAAVEGGLFRLTDALREAIEAGGGSVRTRTGAQWLRSAGDEDGRDGEDSGVWRVGIAPTRRGPTPSDEPVPDGAEEVVVTDRVVLACSAGAALRLLRGVPGLPASATDLTVPVGAPIARFTLVARAPGLSGEPVGSGLLVAPTEPAGPAGSAVPAASGASAGAATTSGPDSGEDSGEAACPARAKALSHLSAKWPWVGAELRALHGPDVHALRLSYGRPGQPRPEVDLSVALDDVAALTGVRIAPDDVVDHMLVRWDGTLPPVTPAYRERTKRLEERLAPVPGLEVTGAWVAGTGIAAVVGHARAAAGRLVNRQVSPQVNPNGQ